MKADHAAIEKWRPLVTHVINKHFSWMYSASGFSGKARRGFDYEDLTQEGVLALYAALKGYDPERFPDVSFKTYAYRTIFNRLTSYMTDNASHLKLSNFGFIDTNASEATKTKLYNAFKYALFSELESGGDGTKSAYDAPNYDIDPADLAEKEDFRKKCIELLQNSLPIREYEILIRHADGESYRTIAANSDLSHEGVRKIHRAAFLKCQQLLYDRRD